MNMNTNLRYNNMIGTFNVYRQIHTNVNKLKKRIPNRKKEERMLCETFLFIWLDMCMQKIYVANYTIR